MESLPDATLVSAAADGDVAAFAQLLKRYRDICTRFVLRMVGNWDDADDILQSSFVRAYRGIGACHDPSRFRAWLYRIVLNECRTFVTRRKRREQWMVREDPETILNAAEAATLIDRAMVREEIQHALDQLPVDHREAFILKYVEDMSYEEMAELTGAGVSALKMRVKRSCDQLQELLEGVIQ
jgi:RNA polymerase sigma-70 factor (ECF subfamily)